MKMGETTDIMVLKKDLDFVNSKLSTVIPDWEKQRYEDDKRKNREYFA